MTKAAKPSSSKNQENYLGTTSILLKGERLCLKEFLADRRTEVKILSMNEIVFTFALCGRKMKGDFHVLEMAAHIMLEEGFCRLNTLFMKLWMSFEGFPCHFVV